MTELVITRGYPGSGKTTYARQWAAQPGRAKAPSRDELRNTLYGIEGFGTPQQEQVITAVQKAAVRVLLDSGLSVVIDDTNLRTRHARDWADLALEHNVHFEVVDIKAGLEDCIARNEARGYAGGRYVDPQAIEDIARRFPIENWQTITPRPELAVTPYIPDFTKPSAWIFDIDGTLAQMSGRGPFDWHRVREDTVNLAVVQTLWALDDTGAKIIIVSGRDSVCRRDTIIWLGEQCIPTEYVYMRPEGDNREDTIVKLELFDKYIRDSFNVRGVFDDRNRVVDMWRRLGIRTFQVAEGNF
ncbi:AAA family ATPase [Nocardia arthritidis]|uniref:AAA family ATPase n=1 Tax=Nocardia arthritidis TaxID=228602 RepID=A0A6G9YTD0_9NOCA|nr:AAA family ATPase [Nocardia arthritidis]QIS16441.1 AAA family ATPase [Nocardia arthritidis]QIS16454.1 AAA family ATPase [Nocardia arthritidis]